MSAHRRRVVLLLGGVCAIVGLVWLWRARRSEAREGGLTAAEWIASTARKMRSGFSEEDARAASDALLKLGTNAFPALQQALTRSSRFGDLLAKGWDKLPTALKHNGRRPVTSDDLRESSRIIISNWPRDQRRRLGRPIVPVLLAKALDPRTPNRDDLIAGPLHDLEPEAELVIPALRHLIRDPKTLEPAMMMLIEYGTAAAPAVPELMGFLNDTNALIQGRAIGILGQIGPSAKAAVPALEKALDGPNRRLVAEALWTIDRQTNTVLRVLPQYVQDGTGNASFALGQLGPAGRPALPALLAGLESTNGNVRMSSSRAIWKVAPENLPRVLAALAQPLTNGLQADSKNRNDWDRVGSAWYAANVLKEMGDDAAPARWALEMGLGAKGTSIVQQCREALEVVGDGTVVPRKPVLSSWFGSTPRIDGVLAADEWADATAFRGVRNWTAEFSPVSDDSDLSLRGWVKHDEERLYFAFEVTDDTLYGIDTDRWLPKENSRAHELTREGYPWFGDELEILLDASNTWRGGEGAEGSGFSWQMVCNLTKSRAGGVGVGGLLEGEPRNEAKAWDTYQSWIRSGAQQAAVRRKPGGHGYFVEWAIRFDPCIEVAPGKFYSPGMGEVWVGLNIALGDLDTPAEGEGNFGNFHHEQWWAGSPHSRTQKNNFGKLHLMGRQTLPSPR